MAVLLLILAAISLLALAIALGSHVRAHRLQASGRAQVHVAYFVGFTHRADADVPTYQWRDADGTHQWVDDNNAVPRWYKRGLWIYGSGSRIYIVQNASGLRSMTYAGPFILLITTVLTAMFISAGLALLV